MLAECETSWTNKGNFQPERQRKPIKVGNKYKNNTKVHKHHNNRYWGNRSAMKISKKEENKPEEINRLALQI